MEMARLDSRVHNRLHGRIYGHVHGLYAAMETAPVAVYTIV